MIKIVHVNRPPVPQAYADAREAAWRERLAAAAAAGKQLWNGELYTVERIDGDTIAMSTCEFKDVVFRIAAGVDALTKKYGYVPQYATADCIPITSDGRFVFGIRGATTNVPAGRVGLIGGTLNRDEVEINSFDDVVAVMTREIEEETDLPVAPLTLFRLNHFESKYEFLFTMHVSIASTAIASMAKPAEFDRLIALTLDEALAMENGLDAFRYAKTYLRDLR